MKNLISELSISMQIQPEIGEYNAIFICPFSVVLHYRPLPAMMAHVSAATGLAYEPMVGTQGLKLNCRLACSIDVYCILQIPKNTNM